MSPQFIIILSISSSSLLIVLLLVIRAKSKKSKTQLNSKIENLNDNQAEPSITVEDAQLSNLADLDNDLADLNELNLDELSLNEIKLDPAISNANSNLEELTDTNEEKVSDPYSELIELVNRYKFLQGPNLIKFESYLRNHQTDKIQKLLTERFITQGKTNPQQKSAEITQKLLSSLKTISR